MRSLFEGKNLVSVYFGGGTPFLFGPDRIKQILDWVNPPKSAEITLEVNPENVTFDGMKQFAAAGINRVSLGIQTLDAPLLTKLGRLHDPLVAKNGVYAIADAGIDNISIDLMYDLPGQTLTSWTNTLEEACKLPIKHLSLYNLTIEPHTVFFKYRNEIAKEVPSEDVSLQMILQAEHLLEQAGLHRYEISAFAHPGYYSKHNTGYWTGRQFIGMGPSAFSYWEGRRFRNIAHLSRYVDFLEKGESPVDFDELLKSPEKERELVAINLRLNQGIPVSDERIDPETKRILNNLCESSEGLLSRENEYYRLTDKGRLFYDTVASDII